MRRLPGRRVARASLVAVLGVYVALLALASLELVPLPRALDAVKAGSAGAADLLRRAGVIPGLALFHDRNDAATSVLANCVAISGTTASGARVPLHRTTTCSPVSTVGVLSDPYDLTLVRLLMDALAFRGVPADQGPTSGDRILAAIGTEFCGAAAAAGRPVGLVHVEWRQTVRDRDGATLISTLLLADWSCPAAALEARRWFPTTGGAEATT